MAIEFSKGRIVVRPEKPKKSFFKISAAYRLPNYQSLALCYLSASILDIQETGKKGILVTNRGVLPSEGDWTLWWFGFQGAQPEIMTWNSTRIVLKDGAFSFLLPEAMASATYYLFLSRTQNGKEESYPQIAITTPADAVFNHSYALFDDNLLSGSEKTVVRAWWITAQAEKTDLVQKATTAGVSAAAFDAAYADLLAVAGYWEAGGNTDISGLSPSLYTRWSSFWTERTKLQNAITNKAITDLSAVQQAASNAQTTADGKIDCYYQASAPTTASEGDLWFDTDDGNKIYTRRSGAWVNTQDSQIASALNAASTAQGTADGKAKIWYQTSQPTGLTAADAGDLWVDTDDNMKVWAWSGIGWVLAQDWMTAKTKADQAYADAQTALANAAIAQAAADGAIKSFYQVSAPAAGVSSEGDIWFDTDDGNKIYTYISGTWVATPDSRIAQALSAASTAQGTADGKAKIWYQTSAPTGLVAGDQGDLWVDTDDNYKVWAWNGSAWVLAQDWFTANTKADSALYVQNNQADDWRITDQEKPEGRKWLAGEKARWEAAYDLAINAGLTVAANSMRDEVWKPCYQYFAPIYHHVSGFVDYYTTGYNGTQTYDAYGSVAIDYTSFPTGDFVFTPAGTGAAHWDKKGVWDTFMVGIHNSYIKLAAQVAAKPASSTSLGLVKAGANITIDSDGTISASGGGGSSSGNILLGGATGTKQSVGGGGPELMTALCVDTTTPTYKPGYDKVAAWFGVPSDTEARYMIIANGRNEWGAGGTSDQDVAFWRNDVGNLTIQSFLFNSTSTFAVHDVGANKTLGVEMFAVDTVNKNIRAKKILVNGAGGGATVDIQGVADITGFRVAQPQAWDPSFATFVDGDNFLRFSFLADGTLKWSDGTTSPDVELNRSSAGTLYVSGTGGGHFVATGNVTGNLLMANGGTMFGPQNPYWCHMYSNLPFYFTQNVHTVGDLEVEGSAYITGNMYANYTSDIKYKTNITPIQDALLKVNKLSGITFDWTEEYITANPKAPQKREAGLIAQEVLEVLPEVVIERSNGDLALDYPKIIALLVEAMKEQTKRIEYLESKIA